MRVHWTTLEDRFNPFLCQRVRGYLSLKKKFFFLLGSSIEYVVQSNASLLASLQGLRVLSVFKLICWMDIIPSSEEFLLDQL